MNKSLDTEPNFSYNYDQGYNCLVQFKDDTEVLRLQILPKDIPKVVSVLSSVYEEYVLVNT